MQISKVLAAAIFLSVPAQAEIVCRATCQATSMEIVSEYLRDSYKDEKFEVFEKDCRANGGSILSAKFVDRDKTDQLGCLGNATLGSPFDRHFHYCVKAKQIFGNGYGNTHVRRQDGGVTSAASQAEKSCRKNVTEFNCIGEAESQDYKTLTMDCKDVPKS